MAGNWIGKATDKMEKKGTKGAFRAQAARNKLSTKAYADKVTKPGSGASEKTRKRAQFALNAMKASKKSYV